MASYNKVLIIRMSALGDVAMTIPQVYSVCRAYPHVNFVMLTQKVASSLYINAPQNLQLHIADTHGRHKGMAGVWRLFRELKSLEIDAVADLHDVMRSQFLRMLFRLANVPVFVIDKGKAEKRKLVSRKHKLRHQLTTSSQRYKAVFEHMKLDYPQSFTSLYHDKGDVSLFEHITPPKQHNERWVGIAPFAKHSGKIYPIESMQKVVEQLSTYKNIRIFLFGAGEREAAILRKWSELYSNVVTLANKREGFPVELSLMSYLDVVVSMDSANMHLASLVHCPVISVWGATHPYAGFLGYNVSPELIVEQPLECRPCSIFGNKPCYRGDYACLRSITPDMIVDKVKKIIDK